MEDLCCFQWIPTSFSSGGAGSWWALFEFGQCEVAFVACRWSGNVRAWRGDGLYSWGEVLVVLPVPASSGAG
jgi:hypothetical protein